MKIINKTIIFKSKPEYYDKERSGKKSNTVRIVSEEDALIQVSEINYIMIKNPLIGDGFNRFIRDITRFVHNDLIIYIFSW